MSPTRRLHGIAALSAAALATAGVAGQAVAADECTDIECLIGENALQLAPGDLDGLLTENISLDFIRSMLEAQGLPPETIDQTMAIYEQMAGLGGGGGSGKVSDLSDLMAAFGGDEIPEEMLIKLGDIVGTDPDDVFAKLELDAGDPLEEALVKLGDMLGETAVVNHEEQYAQPSGALDDAFAKVEFDAGVLVKLGGALTVAEAALAQAAADGDIDQATLEAILGMLPDE